jgi:hypothetical protein
MSRNFAIGGVVVAVVLVCGWALAQQEKAAAPVVGPFAVTAGPDGTILLDTNSGQAWVLFRSQAMHGRVMWLAVGERIDSQEEVVNRLVMEKMRIEADAKKAGPHDH